MVTSSLTVIIPHYGDARPTRALVACLADQCAHIIIVDDASPTPMAEVKGARVVRRGKNGGFGSAVNSGMAQVDTELALILNSDLEVGPSFIADLVTAAAPWQPTVASPRVLSPYGQPDWVGRHFPTVEHQVVEWLTPLARWRHLPMLHEAVGHDTRAMGSGVTPVDWVMGAALLIPVEQFRAVGGFDERYFMNVEEIDLQRRLREIRVPSVVVGSVSVVHEGGGSSDPARRRQWLVSSRLEYARKWGGIHRLGSALVAASVVNLGVNAARRAGGRHVAPIDVWRYELQLIQGRRREQPPAS